MVPAAFTVVDALPLTPHGKVDRRALAAVAGAGRAMAREAAFVAPRTPTEAALAGVWREVLGVERVGVHDNFFALGGDSIRSIRLVALARERGLPFPLAHVFRFQTLAELAAEVGGSEPGDDGYQPAEPFSLVSDEDRARLPDDVEDAYPLARLQAGMLYHAALAPNEPVYHNVDSFRLDTALDTALLREAVRRVVARHPILRTGFRMEGFSEPLQLVHRHAAMEVGVTDLAHLPAGEQQREIAAYRQAELARRFDLSRPPLLRFHAHRLSERAFQFTLTECHAILDGWSLTSTLAEIFSCYAALQGGEAPPEPPPLAVTFRDFVAMERRALASEPARRFWNERLAGFAPQRLPRLPRPEGAPAGRRVESRTLRFGDEVLRGLREVERAEGLPLKSLLLAAHLKVLSAVHGAREVATGFPFNGRPEVDGGEQVRGLFLNTVPFRLAIPAGSWAELARAALEAEREMMPFRRYPMAALQDGRGAEPLFETAFNYVHFHRLGDFLKSGRVETGGDITERADTSFTLVAAFGIGMVYGGLRLILACDAAELSPEQIEAIEGMYRRAVAAIAAGAQARHDAEPLLEPAALQAALRAGDGGPVDARTPLLHRVVTDGADVDPEHEASLVDGGEVLSRAALDRRADRLARHLRARGAGAGTRVAVCLERPAERTAAVLAALRAGAAVVPLDPSEPADRLAATVRAAGASLVVGRADAAERCAGADAVLLDREADEAAAREVDDPAVPVSAEAPAFVLPLRAPDGGERMVVLPHGAVAAAAAALAHALELGPATPLAAAARPGSELEVLEIVAALLARAPLHPAPREAGASPAALAAFLRGSGVRAAVLPPRTLAALRPEDAPGLAAVAAYGGSCPPAVAAAWAPGRRLVVAFGTAEGGLVAAAHRVDSPSPLRRPPVGAPCAGTRVHVLDPALHPVPPGTPGEVCLGGAGLAHGYPGRPALTAERFVPDPFAAEPGARLFRTGERGRRGAGGTLELLDRPDRRVVILGHPVELDELEAALLHHPAVREAAVVARGRGPGRRELVAHAAPAAAGADELRGWLEARFPAFMVPGAVHLHPALPRTAAGEVDRDALAAAAAAVPRVLPDTAVERAVAEVWAEVLGTGQVGVDDNFFDVGGNSLLVARVRTGLMERLGRELSLVELLRHSTIRAQAALLREPGPPPGEAAAPEALDDRAGQRLASRRRRGQTRGAAELSATEVEG
jgi:non-ribosomal peptide synthetase component F/aryl carrier-like protein